MQAGRKKEKKGEKSPFLFVNFLYNKNRARIFAGAETEYFN